MKNLEQIRAANAMDACKKYTFKTKKDSDVVKPLATMVLDCGLLPSMAFALENSDPAYSQVFDAFISHRGSAVTLDKYTEELAKTDATMLRIITAEFVAYIRYLRRFANIKGD